MSGWHRVRALAISLACIVCLHAPAYAQVRGTATFKERVTLPADAGTTRQYSGVGLGLTIARNLAQRMSGEVTITSEGGKGTTVALTLPKAARTETRETAEESPLQEVAA